MSKGTRRLSELQAMQQLPSHNITVTLMEDVSSSLKHRNTALESFKLKRQSTVSRRGSALDVDEFVQVLENIDQAHIDLKPLEQLRRMNIPLALKKKIRHQYTLDRQPSLLSEVESSLHILRWIEACVRIKDYIQTFFKENQLWSKKIKSIQGVFGSGVASYFKFLRWVLYLNIFNFSIIFLFLVVPQLVHDATHPVEYRQEHSKFGFWDIFTGAGYLDKSMFYYGRYTNETSIPYMKYDIPVSYVVTITVLGIINLIAVTRNFAKAYSKSNRIGLASKTAFSHWIFNTWDFGIQSHEAAELKKRCIHRDILELLCSFHKHCLPTRKNERILRICHIAIINVFILSLIGGLGYIIFFILKTKTFQVEESNLSNMDTAIFMAFISVGFHIFLKVLAQHEYFILKETHFYLTVIRESVMRNTMLAVLVYFWLKYEHPVHDDDDDDYCFENDRGQEIYRFLVMNFCVMTILYIIWMGLKKLLSIATSSTSFKIKPPQIDVAFRITDLIYYQSLVWLGSFHSPMLPLLLIFVAIINFYGLSTMIKWCCPPDSEAWLPSMADVIFGGILFCCFLFSTVETGYVLQTATPSKYCGPFRNQVSVISTVSEWIQMAVKKDYSFAMFLRIIQIPSVLLSAYICLFILLHFVRVKANAIKKNQEYFERQLTIVGRDKTFLMKLYEDMLFDSTTKKEKANKSPDTVVRPRKK